MKVALGLAAGVGAAVALIVGYRRARVQEAAGLFKHEKAAVRLTGVYAKPAFSAGP